MTTPSGGQNSQPAGFSSPMGTGNMAKRASAAAAADLAQLASLSEKYKRNMQEAAKAAREVTAEVKKQADLSKGGGSFQRPGVPSIAELRGGSNGFASRIPALGGSPRIPYQPRGAERLPDGRLDLTGYDTPSAVPRAKELGGGAHMPGAPGGGTPTLGGGAHMPEVGKELVPRPGYQILSASGAAVSNGGGANLPTAPGGAGSGMVPYNKELEGEPEGGDPGGGGGGGKKNGGGAKIAGMVAKAAGGLISSVASMGLSTANYEDADFLANRLALSANGGYDKAAQANMITKYFGGGFATQGEALNMAMPILQSGGFAAGTAGFGTLASNATTIAALNPMMRNQAGQVAMQQQGPQMFNYMRMLTGVETLGRGGKPRPIEDVARDLLASSTGGQRILTKDQFAAAFAPTGGLSVTLDNMPGMTPEYKEAIRNVLQADTNAGRFVSAAEVKAHATDESDTITGAKQIGASDRMDLVASHLKEWSDGYQKATKAVGGTMSELAAEIRHAPESWRKGFEKLGEAAGARDTLSPGGKGGGPGGFLTALVGGGLTALFTKVAKRFLPRAGASAAEEAAAAAAGEEGAAATAAGAGSAVAPAAAVAATNYGMHKGSQALWDDANKRDDHGKKKSYWAGVERLYSKYLHDNNLIDQGTGVYHATEGLLKKFGLGDGYGRKEPTQMPDTGWTGVAGAMQPETGDGEGGGRGPQTYKWLENLMNSGPPHRVTSRIRKGAHTRSGGLSYHATGNAIDLGGPTPGRDTNDLLQINRWLANKLGKAAVELIYSGPGGINLWNGQPHRYKPAVANDHHDHVHVAVTEASLKKIGQKVDGSSTPPSDADAGSGVAQTQSERHRKSRKGVPGGFLQRNGFSERKLIEHFFENIRPTERIDPDDTDAEGSASTGADTDPAANGGTAAPAGSNGGAGRAVIEKFLYGLRMHESGGDYNETSKYSTASGAYQYLDSSWNHYAGYRRAYQAPPSVQDQRARLDVGRRYDQYHNWRLVAAAHFRGDGWVKKHGGVPADWAQKGPGVNPSVNAYVKDVLDTAGIPETGDGYGGAVMAAQPMGPDANTVEVRAPMMHRQGGGGSNVRVDNRRGGTIHIAKVEVNLQTGQVSPQEAKRIGKMVVSEIAQQVKMKELMR